MRKLMKGVVLGAVALMVIGGAIPASAKGPVKETFIDEGIYTMPDIDCGTFWLTEQMVSEKVQVATYVDSAGAPTKTVTKADFLGTVTNSSSGHTFRDHASFVETVDYVAGTTTVVGVSYLFVIKGMGGLRRGRLQGSTTATGEVITQYGPNDYEEFGLEGLCNVLL